MGEIGSAEGRSVAVDYPWADGQIDHLPKRRDATAVAAAILETSIVRFG
jgi:hypothetical protein